MILDILIEYKQKRDDKGHFLKPQKPYLKKSKRIENLDQAENLVTEWNNSFKRFGYNDLTISFVLRIGKRVIKSY